MKVRIKLKKMGSLLWVAGITLLAMNAYSSDSNRCSNQNNLKQPLVNSFGRLQPRHQDSVGWCYAYAAADMLSHELGKEISAIDLANAYSATTLHGGIMRLLGRDESDIQAGFAPTALRRGLERGLCLEENVPSSDFFYARNYQSYLEELADIENIYRLYQQRTTRTYSKGELSRSQARMEFAEDLVCRAEVFGDWRSMFPTLGLDELMDILARSTSTNSFVHNLIKENCEPRLDNEQTQSLKVRRNISFLGLGFGTGRLMNQIDEQLDNGKIVAVSYPESILIDPANAQRRRFADHTSTIVARRFNPQTNQCEYMLRNTWGRGCIYHESYECEDGHIWIPENVMRRSVREVTYLEN